MYKLDVVAVVFCRLITWFFYGGLKKKIRDKMKVEV